MSILGLLQRITRGRPFLALRGHLPGHHGRPPYPPGTPAIIPCPSQSALPGEPTHLGQARMCNEKQSSWWRHLAQNFPSRLATVRIGLSDGSSCRAPRGFAHQTTTPRGDHFIPRGHGNLGTIAPIVELTRQSFLTKHDFIVQSRPWDRDGILCSTTRRLFSALWRLAGEGSHPAGPHMLLVARNHRRCCCSCGVAHHFEPFNPTPRLNIRRPR